MAVGALALGILVALFFWSPVSPIALGRADAALGLGYPDLAVARYDQIATFHPRESVREEALYRAAMVWAVDLRNPEEARARLEELVRLAGGSPRLADVHEQIAKLLRQMEAPPVAVAQAYLAAYKAAPKAPRAASRLMDAAKEYADAGEFSAADGLWKRVGRKFSEERATALIARSELALRSANPQKALKLYEEAGLLATNPDVASVAKLGAATCLERLGNLDEALAELDLNEQGDEAQERRAEVLRERISADER